MEAFPLDEATRPAWDELCSRSPQAWFWHTTDWLDYTLAYRPELESRSLSFVAQEEGRVVAAVPLVLEKHVEDGRSWRKFTFGGWYHPAPAFAPGLSAEKRGEVEEQIFALIESLALELDVAQMMVRVSPLAPCASKPERAPCNPFLPYGFIDCSVNSRVIDLRLSERDLLGAMRRNHRRSLEKAGQTLRAVVHAAPDLTRKHFDDYREMHRLAAGRVTRPAETFERMYRWHAAGKGCIVEALDSSGRGVGYETYMAYKGAAYGLSAANDPAAEDALPIRPLIEWEAMRWLKQRGVEFYEIGDEALGALPYDFPDEKLVSISHFKAGFGGFSAVQWRGERFFSRAYWELTEASRRKRFAEGYAWPKPKTGAGAAFLKRIEKAGETKAEAPVGSVPPEVLEFARGLVERNPDAAKGFAKNGDKTVNFLVGRAMAEGGKGRDPKLLKRAIESILNA